MTTRATTWLAQITVVLVLTAAGMASASSGLLGGNSPLGENPLEGRPHQASASVSAELRRGYGRRCWYDASGVSVEPVFNLEVEGDHCYRVGQQGLLVHNSSADPCVLPGFPPLTSGSFKTYKNLDGMGRATGIQARLTRLSILEDGSEATADPPGWVFNFQPPGTIGRGHLLANDLGGRGDIVRNLVVVCQRTTNQQMKSIEQAVKKHINELGGCPVDYEVEPLYYGNDKIPYAIRIRAVSISLTGPECWTQYLTFFWNNPIPNRTDPSQCKGGYNYGGSPP